MTDLQRRFIEFFRGCGDETEAARLAGYKIPQIYGKRCLNVLKPFIDLPPHSDFSGSVADLNEILRFYSAVMRNDFSAGVLTIKDRMEAAKALLKVIESDYDYDKSSDSNDWFSTLYSDNEKS